VLPAAQDFGIGVPVYMPLAGGLLTGKTASYDGTRTRQVEEEYGIRIGPATGSSPPSANCAAGSASRSGS
jgi:aryl-alcohol dehydrogenase-like predicted oxidoreductase